MFESIINFRVDLLFNTWGCKMKTVCLLFNKESNSTMVFKDKKLAEEYLKEWGMKEFESDIWARTQEDLDAKRFCKLSEKEVLCNNSEKNIPKE
jgi:hypothetical protein